jgi:hypothetical protein
MNKQDRESIFDKKSIRCALVEETGTGNLIMNPVAAYAAGRRMSLPNELKRELDEAEKIFNNYLITIRKSH